MSLRLKLENDIYGGNRLQVAAPAQTVKSTVSQVAPASTTRLSVPQPKPNVVGSLSMGSTSSVGVTPVQRSYDDNPVSQTSHILSPVRKVTSQMPSMHQYVKDATDMRNDRIERGFKANKSIQDISNDSGASTNEVLRYKDTYHPTYGDKGLIRNILEGGKNIAVDTFNKAAGIVTKPYNDLTYDPHKANQELININLQRRIGDLTDEAASEKAQQLADKFTNKKVVTDSNGMLAIQQGDTLDFAKKIAQQGVDTSNVVPAGRVVNGVRQAAGAEIAKSIAMTNAKQAAVYGTASTANDVLQGRGITPESLAMNYGAPAVLGTASELAGRGVGNAWSRARGVPQLPGPTATSPKRAVDTPAQAQARQVQELNATQPRLTPEQVADINAQKALADAPTEAMADLMSEARKYKSADEFVEAKKFEKGSTVPIGDQVSFEKTLSPQDLAIHQRLKDIQHKMAALDPKNGYKPYKISQEDKAFYSKYGPEAGKKYQAYFAKADKAHQQLTDLYNQAHSQPTPKVEATQPTVAPKGAPIEKTNVLRDVPIADFKKTDITSWNEAVQNVSKGKFSKTNGPAEVVLTNNGYKLVEGNHRAVQALNKGDATIKAKVISKEGLDEIAKRDGPHIKMGMQDAYTQKQLDAHFSKSGAPIEKTPQVGKPDPTAALKQEARKYKSAEEFVKNTDHTPQTTRVYIKSKFRDGGGYADVPVIREEKNITLYQGGTGENRQFWTPNKEYAKKFGNGEVVKKTGNFYQIDNGNRMTDVYVDADKQLTDLYNQAHAEATPKPKQPTPFEQDLQAAGIKPTPKVEAPQPTVALEQGMDAKTAQKLYDTYDVTGVPAHVKQMMRDNGARQSDINKLNNQIKQAYAIIEPDKYKLASQPPTPKVEAPQPTVAPAKKVTAFESDLKKAGLGVEPDAYRKQPQDVKKAIDAHIANENPQLAYTLDSTIHFPDGIPKVRPEDVKAISGLTPREAGIPPIYVSRNAPPIDKLAVDYETTVRGNTTGELKMTSEDFLDTMMDAIEANRSVGQQTKLIRELRNNPDVIAKAKATLEAERAQYGAPEVVEPSKRDLRDYAKMPNDDEASQKAIGTQGLQNSKSGQRQSQGKRIHPTNQGTSSRSSQRSGRQNPLPDNKARTGRTYPDDTNQEQVRQRGFTSSVQNSAEVSKDVRGKVGGEYAIRSTKKLAADADAFASNTISKITKEVHSYLDTPTGSINDVEIARSIATAKRLDSMGRFEDAQAIYDKLAEHGTKGGQAIQAFSLLSNRTPDGIKYSGIKMLKRAGVELDRQGLVEFDKLIQKVRKTNPGTEARDRAVYATYDFVARRVPTTVPDKLVNIWRAGLLTAPRTTTGNILGNTTELVTRELWSNPIAVATDKFISLFTGKRTKTLAGGRMSGVEDGFRHSVDYLRTGYDPRNTPTLKYDTARRLNYKNKTIDRYVNGIYRWMGAQDQPFYYVAKSEAARDLAKADAINLGLRGSQASDYIDAAVANKDWKPQTFSTRMDAVDYGKYAAYQNETLLGNVAGAIKQKAKSTNSVAGAIADYILPFTQVPSSVAMRIVDRTPLGVAKEIVSQIANRKFDQRALAEAIGNGSFGVAVWSAGVSLANAGLITGAYPSDQKERKLWEVEGKQPYSVRIGDRWYSLNYMQPMGTILAIGKQYDDDIKSGKSPEEAWLNSGAVAAKSVESQSFLQGVNGMLSAINQPEVSGSTIANQLTGSLMPNLVRSMNTAADPYQREVNNPLDSFIASLPVARQTLLNTKRDMFGKDITARDNPINLAVNPLRPSLVKGEGDIVVNELRRLQDVKEGIVTTKFDMKSISGVELSDTQVRELDTKINSSVKEVWSTVISDPRYGSLTDSEKADVLKKAKDDVAESIKKQFVLDNGLTTTAKYKDKSLMSAFRGAGSGETYAEDYQSALSEMNSQDVKNWSPVERAKKEKRLRQLSVQKDFEKDTVSLYGMTKNEVYALVSKDPNGKKYVEDILKYGDALVAAGLAKYNKFRDRYGNTSLYASSAGGTGRRVSSRSGKKGGGRRGRRSTKGKFDYKLDGFSKVASTNSSLRQLLKKAKMRQGIA